MEGTEPEPAIVKHALLCHDATLVIKRKPKKRTLFYLLVPPGKALTAIA